MDNGQISARYVVAVSGGVDSVVLLDMLVNKKLPPTIYHLPFTTYHLPPTIYVVAHFDHGIRSDSAEDTAFVRQLAAKYELPFETKREELGANASEELARDRRYAFLREVAKKYDAKIMTAHHADDVIETIAINLTRGTGWRGLAVLDSPDVERPLLRKAKSELIEYARQYDLQWREDMTNRDTKYLRNDLRKKLSVLDADTRKLLGLYRERQVVLRRKIEREAARLIGESPYSRYLFINAPEDAALEMLRAALDYHPTRPQLVRALLAIKVFREGRRYEVASGISLKFTRTQFIVEKRG